MDENRKKEVEELLGDIRTEAIENPNQDAAQMAIVVSMEKALSDSTTDEEECEYIYRGLKKILKELYRLEDEVI